MESQRVGHGWVTELGWTDWGQLEFLSKNMFPLKSEIRPRLILSPVLFNILLKGLLNIIWQEKYIRGTQTGKEETNIISVFRGWCCLRKPKETVWKILQTIMQ